MTVWLVEENAKLKSDLEQAHFQYKELEDKYNLAAKQYDSLLKKCNEVLTLAKNNADINEVCLQELEKENERLKQILEENGIFEVQK